VLEEIVRPARAASRLVRPAEESIKRAEDLLERLERARERLESTEDPEVAIDVLAELAEIAKQVEVEILRARREAESEEQEVGGADA
jgi:hypothetical protein